MLPSVLPSLQRVAAEGEDWKGYNIDIVLEIIVDGPAKKRVQKSPPNTSIKAERKSIAPFQPPGSSNGDSRGARRRQSSIPNGPRPLNNTGRRYVELASPLDYVMTRNIDPLPAMSPTHTQLPIQARATQYLLSATTLSTIFHAFLLHQLRQQKLRLEKIKTMRTMAFYPR